MLSTYFFVQISFVPYCGHREILDQPKEVELRQFDTIGALLHEVGGDIFDAYMANYSCKDCDYGPPGYRVNQQSSTFSLSINGSFTLSNGHPYGTYTPITHLSKDYTHRIAIQPLSAPDPYKGFLQITPGGIYDTLNGVNLYAAEAPIPYDEGAPAPYDEGAPVPYDEGTPISYDEGTPISYDEGTPISYDEEESESFDDGVDDDDLHSLSTEDDGPQILSQADSPSFRKPYAKPEYFGKPPRSVGRRQRVVRREHVREPYTEDKAYDRDIRDHGRGTRGHARVARDHSFRDKRRHQSEEESSLDRWMTDVTEHTINCELDDPSSRAYIVEPQDDHYDDVRGIGHRLSRPRHRNSTRSGGHGRERRSVKVEYAHVNGFRR